MCGDNNLFGDLEDKDFWNSDDVVVEETAEDKALKEAVGTSMNRATNAIYEEKCTARGCRNGTFVSWAGNPIGPCFKCKGTGIRKFKTGRSNVSTPRSVKLPRSRPSWTRQRPTKSSTLSCSSTSTLCLAGMALLPTCWRVSRSTVP